MHELQAHARELIRRFKDSHYVFGLNCLDQRSSDHFSSLVNSYMGPILQAAYSNDLTRIQAMGQ